MGKLWQAIWSLFTELFAVLLVGGIITAGLSVWAWFQSWPGPLLGLFILGSLGLSLFTLNEFYRFRRQRDKGFTSRSNEQIKNTLLQWLQKEGYGIWDESQPTMLFQLRAQDKIGRNLVIGRPRDLPDILVVGAVGNIPEPVKSLVNALSSEIRENIFRDLRLQLVGLQMAYRGLEFPLQKVIIETRITFDESFTKAVFLEGFNRTKYGYMLVSETIRDAIRKTGNDPDALLSPIQPVPHKAGS